MNDATKRQFVYIKDKPSNNLRGFLETEALLCQAEISFKAGKEVEARKIGELLCSTIGNQVLASMEAGKLLADQLKDIVKLCQTDAGIIFKPG